MKYRTHKSPIHGRGVFARGPIRRGERVGILRGKVLDSFRLGRGPQYVVELDCGHLVPAFGPRGLWLMNHRCSPNAALVLKRVTVEVVALRAIPAGREITCDYRPTYYGGTLKCRCGAENCGGYI